MHDGACGFCFPLFLSLFLGLSPSLMQLMMWLYLLYSDSRACEDSIEGERKQQRRSIRGANVVTLSRAVGSVSKYDASEATPL